MTEPAFRRPPTAQEAVLAALRQAIGSGELRPGEQVRQDALAERFGVSRVPLREALKILEGEGSVTYLPHRGYFVAELSLADLEEVYRIRELLEEEAVRTAVPRLTADGLDELAALVADCEDAGRAGDVAAMTAANRSLHFALFAASDRPRLVRMVRILWDATDAYRSLYYSEPREPRTGGGRAPAGAGRAALRRCGRGGPPARRAPRPRRRAHQGRACRGRRRPPTRAGQRKAWIPVSA